MHHAHALINSSKLTPYIHNVHSFLTKIFMTCNFIHWCWKLSSIDLIKRSGKEREREREKYVMYKQQWKKIRQTHAHWQRVTKL